MAFLIRTIDVTASGRKIVRDREVDKPQLSIGRSSESDIHLTDLAVEQNHLVMRDAGAGDLAVESVGGLGFGVDGKTVESAIINPSVGAEVSVGSARLAISRDGGKDSGAPVQIVINQVEKDEGAADALSGFALASALPSKRAMAWVFAGAILVLLLSVPVITHLLRTPVENDPENLQQGQVLLDSAWSTGDLSMSHHDLEENCEACHVSAFVSVQDETCLTCHEEIGDHAQMDDQRTGMPAMSQGDAIQWQIAETFGKEGPLGCVSCHTEHEGAVVTQHPATEQFCSDCHDELDTRLTKVDFGNAADFGEKHPEFRPRIFTAQFADSPERVLLPSDKARPVEESGLKFTHYDHMKDEGGVARMAVSLNRYGEPLECHDCHVEWTAEERDELASGGLTDEQVEGFGAIDWSDDDRKRLRGSGFSASRIQNLGDFKPVVMEDACESCHSLVVDEIAGGRFRNLTHGNVDELMAQLASLDRGPRSAVTSGRGRPGQFGRGGRYYSNFGRPMAGYLAINRAFDSKGVCGECHIPTTTNGRADLTPVNLPQRFLMKGYFDHQAHEENAAGEPVECASCHFDAEQGLERSNKATDLLIPNLASCRDCHQGETAAETVEITPSGCAMCHGYHTPTAPWRPEDHEKLPGNGGNDNVAAILSSLRP